MASRFMPRSNATGRPKISVPKKWPNSCMIRAQPELRSISRFGPMPRPIFVRRTSMAIGMNFAARSISENFRIPNFGKERMPPSTSA